MNQYSVYVEYKIIGAENGNRRYHAAVNAISKGAAVGVALESVCRHSDTDINEFLSEVQLGLISVTDHVENNTLEDAEIEGIFVREDESGGKEDEDVLPYLVVLGRDDGEKFYHYTSARDFGAAVKSAKDELEEKFGLTDCFIQSINPLDRDELKRILAR